ncbi:MAG: NTP transferase domain-containing protein [Thermodesulfobacteriota bacterium]
MKAIILAAGMGSRLRPYTDHMPKCLLNLGGVSILENQINHIRDCGINDVVIVVGFGFEKVESFLRRYNGLGIKIKTIYNPFYQTTNSLVSLCLARGEMDDDLVVMNGDDIFEIDILDKMINTRKEKIVLPVKRKENYDNEDMKVRMENGHVSLVTKDIEDGIDYESVGVRLFRGTGVEMVKRASEEEMRGGRVRQKWYVSCIQRLLNKGYKIKPFDIGDMFWMDVDYPKDLFLAKNNSDKFVFPGRRAAEAGGKSLKIVSSG